MTATRIQANPTSACLEKHLAKGGRATAMRAASARAAAFAVTAALLAGCTTTSRTAPPVTVADAEPRQSAHEAAVGLAARDCSTPGWRLEGRVAVSNGKDGGSGRIDWAQGNGRYEIALSAPITRQSWRLTGTQGLATLDGLEGGTRTGADADALLRDATRWDIPVAALGCWIRGARADAARFGDATLAFNAGADGRLARLVQDGWTIDYTAWQPATATAPALPQRLVATRGEAKVRVIVDAWSTL